MRISVPTKWQELSEWQLKEFAIKLLSKPDDISDLEVVRILFTPKKSFRNEVRFFRLMRKVALSDLLPYTHFLNTEPNLYKFPCLEKLGVKGPGDRLNKISVEQFSVADTLFYNWRKSKDELHLRQLVASLYAIDDFDKLRLPEVAELTDKVDLKTMYVVGLVYLSVRSRIEKQFPVVFPKPKEEDTMKPVFRKRGYTPFSKLITAMAMSETQPLGTYKEAKETNLYEFLDVLSESIIQAEKRS